MPGKHAPDSPRSFVLSVARAGAGALAVLGLVVVIALVAVGSRGDKRDLVGGGSPTPTATETVVEPTVEPTPVVTESPIPAVRPPAKVTVIVLNGTSRNGLANRVRTQLQRQRYVVKRVGNTGSTPTSTIYYQSGAKREADAMLRAHPEFGQVQPATGTTPKDALLTVVLGDDYP